MKNLQELGVSPFHYIAPIIPCPLSEELIKGENFILTDLLKSILGSSSQARFAQEQEAQGEITQGALVSFVRLDQSPSAIQDPKPTPRRRRRGRVRRGRRLDG